MLLNPTSPPSTSPSPPALADPPLVRASLHPRPAEAPIFFDPHGRRARRVKLASGMLASATALWLAGLVGGPLGFLALPHLPSAGPAALASAPAVGLPTGIAPLQPSAGRRPRVIVADASDRGTRPTVAERRAHLRRSHRRTELT